MKQEKITPESIIKKRYPFYDENLEMKDVELNGGAVQALMEDYHIQSLQQLLDEASEELPDDDSIKANIKKYAAIGTSSFQWGLNLIHIAKWMRSEAAKTVVKLKEDNDRSIKALGNSYDKARAEIQQLKEELARKEGDIVGFAQWFKITELGLADSGTGWGDLIKKYQASKTDKPTGD